MPIDPNALDAFANGDVEMDEEPTEMGDEEMLEKEPNYDAIVAGLVRHKEEVQEAIDEVDSDILSNPAAEAAPEDYEVITEALDT